MAQLFQSTTVGGLKLAHRIVYAPLTRLRNSLEGVPPLEAVEYYAQRASTPGTLLIAEGTIIAAKAGGIPLTPGIWSDEQIESWKRVTQAIHEKGSYIYLQIAGLGRGADPDALAALDPPASYVAPSPLKPSTKSVAPRALTKEEIHEYVQLFKTAAINAVYKAGFDGVEVHGACGHLLDQFLSTKTNVRTDQYGGSPENRSRFSFEVLDAVVGAIGAQRTAYRVSPWGDPDMRMEMSELKNTYIYLITQLRERYPDLAYLHAVEGRIFKDQEIAAAEESNDFMRDIWAPRPFVNAGGYDGPSAFDVASKKPNQLVAFGRHFLANPDLPRRLKEDIPLNKYDRSTFYGPGEQLTKGYTDYPFAPVTQNTMQVAA